jgi:hypothetical protein
MKQEELKKLQEILFEQERYDELGFVGDKVDGFETVEIVSESVDKMIDREVITKSPSGIFFKWCYAEGLGGSDWFIDKNQEIQEITE